MIRAISAEGVRASSPPATKVLIVLMLLFFPFGLWSFSSDAVIRTDGKPVQGAITRNHQVDRYEFSSISPGIFDIEASTPDANQDLVLKLLGPGDSSVLIEKDGTYVFSSTSQILTYLSGGVYHLTVETSSGQAKFSYEIYVKYSPDTQMVDLKVDAGEHNGDFRTPFQVDSYRFTITSTRLCSVQSSPSSPLTDPPPFLYQKITGSTRSGVLKKTNPDDYYIYSPEHNSEWLVLTAGTYYVLVKGTGPYTIEIKTEQKQLTPLVTNGPAVKGTLDANDADAFQFKVASKGIYKVETKWSPSKDMLLSLYGPYEPVLVGNARVTGYIYSSIKGDASVVGDLSAGGYYVVAQAYSDVGDYSIRLTKLEFDPKVTVLSIDAPAAHGNISKAGEVDVFAFIVSDPGLYAIETMLGSNPDTVVSLYGPNNSSILIAENENKSSAFRILKDLQPGIYYVTVRSASSNQTGTYRIGVTHPIR